MTSSKEKICKTLVKEHLHNRIAPRWSSVSTVVVWSTQMPWDGLSWGLRAPEDSEEGERTDKHDRRETWAIQVRGSRKEITPLLLLYDVYLSSQRTTMALLELFGERRKKLSRYETINL
jgi:hypothetical protein